jgi:phospholipid transport system transporter-binding protein
VSTVQKDVEVVSKCHGGIATGSVDFIIGEGGRACVQGLLSFTTVTALLAAGTQAIEAGQVSFVDLSRVTAGDSAGLALLIEWLSVARAAGRELRYENVPSQLMQLARLSEIEDLLEGASPGAEQLPGAEPPVAQPSA